MSRPGTIPDRNGDLIGPILSPDGYQQRIRHVAKFSSGDGSSKESPEFSHGTSAETRHGAGSAPEPCEGGDSPRRQPETGAGPSERGGGPSGEFPGPAEAPELGDPESGDREPEEHSPDDHDRQGGERTGFSLANLEIFVAKEAAGAISRTSVDELASNFTDDLVDVLVGQSDAGPVAAERLIGALGKEFHVILLRNPAEEALGDLQIPGKDFLAAVIEHAPIHIIDAPLGSIKRWIEIGGILLGVATGNHALAAACFKALLRSLVRQFLMEELTSLLSGDSADRPPGKNTARRTSNHPAGKYPDIVSMEFSAPGKGAGIPVPGLVPQPRSAAESIWRPAEMPSGETRPRWSSPAASEPRSAAPGQGTFTRRGHGQPPAARASRRTAEASAPPAETWIREVHERAMWQAGVPAAGFSASSVGSARPHFIDMRFVHLGIHYNARDLAGRLPVSAQASPLTEVMVVHQSSPVRVPGLSVRGAGTMASAEELEQLIAHQLRVSNTTKTRHLWYSNDSLGLTGDSHRTNALSTNLRRVLLGQRPLYRADGNMIPLVVHYGIEPQYTRHIDVVAFISGIPAGRPQVESIGFRVQDRDGFSRIVISAMDGLVTADSRV